MLESIDDLNKIELLENSETILKNSIKSLRNIDYFLKIYPSLIKAGYIFNENTYEDRFLNGLRLKCIELGIELK